MGWNGANNLLLWKDLATGQLDLNPTDSHTGVGRPLLQMPANNNFDEKDSLLPD